MLAAIVLLIVWVVIRCDAPPLRVLHDNEKTRIDVSTLGEYPTTVSRVRLSDSNGRAVWELRADHGVAQIHGVTLVRGQNPSQIQSDYGVYTVVTPQGSTTFVLTTGTRYKIEVWGGTSGLTKSSAVFGLSD